MVERVRASIPSALIATALGTWLLGCDLVLGLADYRDPGAGNGGMGAGGVVSGGVGVGSFFLTQDPGLKWWRVSEMAGDMTFEGSSDGIGWTLAQSRPVAWPLDAVKIRLGMTATTGGTTRVAFSNLNAPPP